MSRSEESDASAGTSQTGRAGVYDKFRERVIFPIRDQNGHAVGLGGRLLQGEGPKYLNSPATPLFDKSRTLYLIDKAKGAIRKSGQAVIVEGYTDALMAHQAGFENVVASLGTALTPGQVALLTRYASRIVLAYDVDAAGEKAGTLGVTSLAGLIGQLQGDTSGVKLEDVRVARLPDGKDPDEVVREAPADWGAWQALVLLPGGERVNTRGNVVRYLGLDGPEGPGYDQIAYTVRLKTAGATSDQLAELRRACERASPVGDTLRRSVALSLC